MTLQTPGLHRLRCAYSFWRRCLGPILRRSMRGHHPTRVGPRARPSGSARPALDPASTITASWPLTLTLPRHSQMPALETWCKLNKNRMPLGEWESLLCATFPQRALSIKIINKVKRPSIDYTCHLFNPIGGLMLCKKSPINWGQTSPMSLVIEETR